MYDGQDLLSGLAPVRVYAHGTIGVTNRVIVVLLAVWLVSLSYRYWPVGILVGIFSWQELLKIWREPSLFS